MPTTRTRAVCAAGMLFALPAWADIHPIRTQRIEIDYHTDPQALPLLSVELWCTRDQGQSWSVCHADDDRRSPIVFHANAEGLYGFIVVLRNQAGYSSLLPGPGSKPQIEAFVDFTPPLIQLHAPSISGAPGNGVIEVRWTVIDANLDVRPIAIAFQQDGVAWQPLTPEPLANTGRFDWTIPPGLIGTVRIKAAVTDLAGNRTESNEQTVEVTDPAAEPAGPDFSMALDSVIPGSPRTKERVADLLTEAVHLREQGNLAGGVARLREAVRLNPQAIEAFSLMGAMLLQARDPDRALEAFELALQHRPKDRAALFGSALALREKRQYAAATDKLRTILRLRPADAEIWMALGDVAVFQGDELLARECYLRASQIDPAASTIIAEAQQRLAIMDRGRPAASDGKPPAVATKEPK